MKKINFKEAFWYCTAFILLRLSLPQYNYSRVFNYLNEIFFFFPFILLLLYLYVFTRAREMGIVISLSLIFINMFLSLSLILLNSTMGNGVEAHELTAHEIDLIVYSSLLSIGLLIVTILMVRRKQYENIRYIFFIYLAIIAVNILTILKVSFFKDENIVTLIERISAGNEGGETIETSPTYYDNYDQPVDSVSTNLQNDTTSN